MNTSNKETTKQKSAHLKVATSSCVSELYAISDAYKQVLNLRGFLNEQNFPQEEPTPIYSDCESAMLIAGGVHPGRFKGSKHVERRHFMVQQGKLLNEIDLKRAPTDDNIADIGCAYKNAVAYLKFRFAIHQTKPDAPAVPYKKAPQASARK